MNIGLLRIAENIGVSFETVIIILVLVMGIIFYSSDVRLGLILHFFMFLLVFMWFYSVGLNFVPALTLMFIFFTLMSLSLYATDKVGSSGSFI